MKILIWQQPSPKENVDRSGAYILVHPSIDTEIGLPRKKINELIDAFPRFLSIKKRKVIKSLVQK